MPPITRSAVSFDQRFTPEQLVDRWDYDISTKRYLGDAFPHVWPDFGPGIMAAFVGGEASVSDTSIWFYPGEFKGLELADIRLAYREDSQWLERICAACRHANERWGGLVQVGMTDLGGTLDILSSLRPAESLLMDLYDAPEEVERLVWEIHDLWFRYYDLIDECLPANPGYSSWPEVFSQERGYMLQCDLAYMISPEMFDRFVEPELRRACQRLPQSFYHQDGVGQLAHTPSLHAIPELSGVQWQPGDGQAPSYQWWDQQRRIRDDGKLSQTWGGPEALDELLQNVGDISHIVLIGTGHISEEEHYREVLRKHGIDD
jgi:5-methyltetrahydrofolate--homocysteine methyltransferase